MYVSSARCNATTCTGCAAAALSVYWSTGYRVFAIPHQLHRACDIMVLFIGMIACRVLAGTNEDGALCCFPASQE